MTNTRATVSLSPEDGHIPRPNTMAAFGIFGHLGRWPQTPEDGHPGPKMAKLHKPVSPYIYRRYLYIYEDGHPRYRSGQLRRKLMGRFGKELQTTPVHTSGTSYFGQKRNAAERTNDD